MFEQSASPHLGGILKAASGVSLWEKLVLACAMKKSVRFPMLQTRTNRPVIHVDILPCPPLFVFAIKTFPAQTCILRVLDPFLEVLAGAEKAGWRLTVEFSISFACIVSVVWRRMISTGG